MFANCWIFAICNCRYQWPFLTGNKVELEWTKGILNPVKVFVKVPLDYEVISINNSGHFKRIDKKDFSIIEYQKEL